LSTFTVLASLPLLLSLFVPLNSPLAYPPYYPPNIQEKAQWLRASAFVITDLPWSVAWYGHRQSVWLSLIYRQVVSPQSRDDLSALNDLGKPIRALYLSTRTLKSVETAALSAWMRGAGGEHWEEAVSDWDSFVLLGVYLKQEVPTGFPLKRAPFGVQPELFLGESERNSGKPIKGE